MMNRDAGIADPVQEMLRQAWACYVNGDFGLATQCFETVLQSSPGQAGAWHGLGLIALSMKEMDPALDFLSEAAALEPGNATYLADLGETYRRRGELDLALAYLERARELAPDAVDVLINLGCILGERGKFDDARELLQRAMEFDPARAAVYYNLGTLEQRDGHNKQAQALLGMAVALDPSNGTALAALGETARRMEKAEEAEAAFERAIGMDPGNSMARAGLADIAAERGDFERARRVLQEAPPESEVLPLLLAEARILEGEGKEDEAIVLYEKALAQAPRDMAAPRCLAAIYRERKEFHKALDCLLVALMQDDQNCQLLLDMAGLCHRDLQYSEAATYFYRRALQLRPGHVPTLIAVGNSLSEAERHDEGLSCFTRALEIDPASGEVWACYAYAQMRAGHFEASLSCNRKALECEWDGAAIYNNMGNVYWRMGDLASASQHYEKALALRPGQLSPLSNLASIYFEMGEKRKSMRLFQKAANLPMSDKVEAQFRLNRSFCHFAAGKLKEGWADYEYRPMAHEKHYFAPQWKGEDLAGKTILLWQDQGIGDVLMFGTMYGEIVERAGHVLIECAAKLVPLLRRTFPRATVVPLPSGKGPHPLVLRDVDYQISQGSLGLWLRPNLASFPRSRSGYLRVDPERRKHWRRVCDALGPEPKVGICWRSKVQDGGRAQYYSSLGDWGAVLRNAGVRFINLQYDDCTKELAAAKADFGADISVFEEVDMFNDIDETAALIASLDLVISAPTAVAMTAAGVGVPVWFMADAGWLGYGSSQHKWFANIRSFGKQWNEKWAKVTEMVGAELEKFSKREQA